jgi:hypothetical protein
MYIPGLGFRAAMAGRTLWGVTTSAGDLPWLAEPLVSTINNWAAFLKMNFGGVLRGNSTAPGDVLKDTDALARAKTFFAQDAPPARFPGGYTRPESDTESAAQPPCGATTPPPVFALPRPPEKAVMSRTHADPCT